MAQVDSVVYYGILKYHVLNLKIDSERGSWRRDTGEW